jgi:hypothetical protein
MARKSQLKSPRFTLTPAAPSEVVQQGMETVKADLAARLTQ